MQGGYLLKGVRIIGLYGNIEVSGYVHWSVEPGTRMTRIGRIFTDTWASGFAEENMIMSSMDRVYRQIINNIDVL